MNDTDTTGLGCLAWIISAGFAVLAYLEGAAKSQILLGVVLILINYNILAILATLHRDDIP